jgi:VWFA-related protein
MIWSYPLRSVVIPVLLAVTAAPLVTAQQPPPTPAPIFIDTVKVNIVNVEVFVHDKSGKPVLGLTPADFAVLEDGKPMEITNFYAAGPPAGAVTTAPEGTAVAEATPAPTPAPVPEPQRLSLVFFIDNADISLAQRQTAVSNLEKMIRRSLESSAARAMLVTGGTRVAVRQPFTADVPALLAALREAAKDIGQGAALNVDRAMIARLLEQTAFPTAGSSEFAVDDVSSILEQIRHTAQGEYERTRWILEALTTFVDSLAGVEGRKVIFFVSGGLSMRPGQGLLERWESRFGRSPTGDKAGLPAGENARLANTRPGGGGFNAVSEAIEFDVTPYFNELVRHANASGVTFYAIDAMGNRGLSAISAETTGLSDPSVAAGEAMSTQQSLQLLAGATGGQLSVNNPDMSSQIDRTVEDFTTYYSLGYAAPHDGDGAYHKITVKVERPGVKLRYREGYLDRPADERRADRSLSALLFDTTSNPLGVGLSVRAQVKQPDGTYLVTLLVTVPLSGLALLPRGQLHEGTLSLWLAAKDAGGENVTQAPKLTYPVRIPNERLLTALGQSIGYTYQLRMSTGAKRVAVCLSDELAQTDATSALEFTVGDADGGAASPE